MAKKTYTIARGKNLTQKVPNAFIFDSPGSVTLFNMGTFAVRTNMTPKAVYEYSDRIITSATEVSLEDLRQSSLARAQDLRDYTNRLDLRLDPANFSTYATFGALSERFRVAIEQVTKNWPGNLFVSPYLLINPLTNQPGYGATVYDYKFTPTSNLSSFRIPVNLTQERYGVIIREDLANQPSAGELNNLYYNYLRYCLQTADGKALPIIKFTGVPSLGGYFVEVVVKGEAFPAQNGIDSVPFAAQYHIRPNDAEMGSLIKKLPDLSQYLLNFFSDRFTAVFRYPGEDVSDVEEELEATWPSSDGFNPDEAGSGFINYQAQLLNIGRVMDDRKSNWLVRYLTPANLYALDNTDDNKMFKLVNIYGRMFDRMKNFIDGLAYVNTVTYDRINNAPDALVLNLANTLGWETFPLVTEGMSLSESIFGTQGKTQDKSFTPADVDLELWRRIVINTAWLFRQKGTRQVIEAVFGLVGAPEELVEFNEHVYIAGKRLSFAKVDSEAINPEKKFTSSAPESLIQDIQVIDQAFLQEISEEYNGTDLVSIGRLDIPTTEVPDYDNAFQVPTPYFQSTAPGEDNFLAAYNTAGFSLRREIDNKKSWVRSDSSLRLHLPTETSYQQSQQDNVINSKELSMTLNPAKAVEYDVYTFNKQRNYPIASGRTGAYPQGAIQQVNTNNLTFLGYVKLAYEGFIDARTRKTSVGYPTLERLYQDYLKNTLDSTGYQSSELTTNKVMRFVSKMNAGWGRLMEQLIPATSIMSESGIELRNIVFTTQKFVYRPGLNAGAEISVAQPIEFSESIRPISLRAEIAQQGYATIRPISCTGDIAITTNGDVITPSYGVVFNRALVKPRISSEFFSLTPPIPQVSGATKILDGTKSIILDNPILNSKSLSFIFDYTDGDKLRVATGPQFGYLLYSFNYDINKFENKPSFKKLFPKTDTPISGLGTKLTINDTIPANVLKPDQHYLLKTFFTIPYVGNSSSTSLIINTEPDLPIDGIGMPYGHYVDSRDWYFATVENPEEPRVILPTKPVENYTQTLKGPTVGNALFKLEYRPLSDVIFKLNGNVLKIKTDYLSATKYGEAFGSLVYNMDFALSPQDILTATFLTSYEVVTVVNKTVVIPTMGIPIGTALSYPEQLTFNTLTNKIEFTTATKPMNGSQLALFFPTSKTLVSGFTSLNSASNVWQFPTQGYGPVASEKSVEIWYILENLTPGGFYAIPGTTFSIDWELTNPTNTSESGDFTIQFAAEKDYGFDTILYSEKTAYIPSQLKYYMDLELIPGSVFVGLRKYLVRILSEKSFTTFNGDSAKSKLPSKTYLVRYPQQRGTIPGKIVTLDY